MRTRETVRAAPDAVAALLDGSGNPVGAAALDTLIADLFAVRAAMLDLEQAGGERLAALPPGRRDSARNLLHYLALRQEDVRPLQERLGALGLSSLGRSEAHALASVDAVLSQLHRLAGRPWAVPPAAGLGFAAGSAALEANTAALLGPLPDGRDCRVMVTMPSEAATDYALVRGLLEAGMDCMRVNCAHDDAAAWGAMVGHLRRAEAEVGRPCRVLMDLAGPKLRTGPLAPGSQVLKCRPRRDDDGRVLAPARLWLTAEVEPAPAPQPATGAVPLPAAWLATLAPGDELTLTDARGARRTVRIAESLPGGCWAECDKTIYFESGTRLTVRGRRRGAERPDGAPKPEDGPPRPARVGALPPLEQPLRLKPGDVLIVTREQTPGHPETPARPDGTPGEPAQIACTLPEVFGAARPGERIWFDDGKIGGVIRAAGPDALRVEITQAQPGGSRLRAEKGINLPDTDLPVAPLSAKDVADLPFIAAHADLVALSFVRDAEAVLDLERRLTELGSAIGVVLKIETRRGFEQLPRLLLAALRAPAAGVMIARGDLAVEAGYVRLAEVQEEVLWLAEAVHLPVIWATQVLETLARTGQPTRAEITDAAMAGRAECVMLNKGPHVTDAVRVLDDILRRMQDHQSKKVALLRRLRPGRRRPCAMPEASEARRAAPTRVAVVGAGHVGAAFAYALRFTGLAAELVLIDVNRARAEGEAMDLTHAVPFTHPTRIWAGDYADCAGAAVTVVTVVTAGANQQPGESRLDLVARNHVVVGAAAPPIAQHNPNGIILVATNPVDVLTASAQTLSGLPPERVIGSGTVLDTARFRHPISRHFGVDARSVHASIIGEHGDSEVPVWSLANIAGMRLAEYGAANGVVLDAAARQAISTQTRDAAARIIERKGATYYAIGAGLLRVVGAILRDQHTVLTVSSRIEGFSGLSGLCFSLPTVIDRGGVEQVIRLHLSDDEQTGLQRSAAVLRGYLGALA